MNLPTQLCVGDLVVRACCSPKSRQNHWRSVAGSGSYHSLPTCSNRKWKVTCNKHTAHVYQYLCTCKATFCCMSLSHQRSVHVDKWLHPLWHYLSLAKKFGSCYEGNAGISVPMFKGGKQLYCWMLYYTNWHVNGSNNAEKTMLGREWKSVMQRTVA